ncbi:hypothetical protein EDC96DRAFT_569938 [Choanephora cucurbitarum]|nr:hypothetical protein EDC96DRAFT_569938 [Choanephora cucurbitarum]
MLTPISIFDYHLSLAMPVHSYCIYTRYKQKVSIIEFARHQAMLTISRSELKPGESACCPWTVKDCVKSGGQNDVVTVAYRCMQGGMIDWRHELVKSFNPDGSPFEGNPRVDLQAGEN